MNARGRLQTYSYLLAGLVWALAVCGALVFALVSGVRHLLWIETMNSHPMVPVWLEGGIALVALAIVVFWYRIASAALQYRRKRRHLAKLLAPRLRAFPYPVPDALRRVADWYLIEDRNERAAFTLGGKRPRIAISQGLWNALDEPARTAVMHHEAAHARFRDPLQQTLLQVLAAALRPLGMGALYRRYLLQREVAADAVAVSACGGDDAPLLYALLTVAKPRATMVARVGLTGALDARMEFLESQKPPAWWDQRLRFHVMSSTVAICLTLGEGLMVWCH